MYCRALLLSLALIGALGTFGQSARAADSPTTKLIASGFTHPVYMCTAPGDTSRMFVLEKRGIIWLIKNGVRQAQPFMNCSTFVYDVGDERGFAGMVFHPNFQINGYFYLNYNRQGDSAEVVSRFYMPNPNADTCSTATQTVMLVIPQPGSIHKAGMMEFGPWDNYLYVSSGDGSDLGDTANPAQDSTKLLGKILRLDVNKGDLAVAPPDNPFVNRPGWRPEIWALGFRNPWRFSFDRGTGDLWIGDVGQYLWEEVDYQPHTSKGGENYGWHFKEGFHCYKPATGCDNLGYDFTDPILEFSHDTGCAIIGGYVYQGCAMPTLRGTYFYADFCGHGVWSCRYGATGVYDTETWTTSFGLAGKYITSFAQDVRGELYIITYDGGIYKIVNASGQSACSGCCIGLTGNVDGKGQVDLSDLSLLIGYLTRGATLPCPLAANLNGTGSIDLSDLSYLIAYITGVRVLRAPCQ